MFMRDSRKMPKIDVICSFFVLRSADFLMYIICTRHFFDFSILIFCIFHFLLFDFFKNLKIHFLNFPELNFSDFRFSIFSNFKKHNFYRKKFRGREKTIFASSSSIYHGFAIYDSNSIFCRSGPWFSQAETARSESLRLIPLVRNSSYLSWAILRRMS